ncbi:hypothetical protein [Sabulicella glaciei]|uniref:Uncharacterized protein n=1 Tax=Sabulicella glaciei TaxID=2984948 RepID=A0ABT3P312_9PROT|nr:hypothetical protein [Roseococcus sp. MDT2-1-1]MCW8088164.1 hypothetical protein [Roseococcus sp. MDT2-1-1]
MQSRLVVGHPKGRRTGFLMSARHPRGSGTAKDLLAAAGLLLFTLLGSLFVGALPQAGQTRFVAVFPPWQDLLQSTERVGRAGGMVVATGGFHNFVTVQSDDPAFVSALYRSGALLVLDLASARGCSGLPASSSTPRERDDV